MLEGMNPVDPAQQKIERWARNPRVMRTPRIANLPAFRSRKFDSYAEFNEWKQNLLLQLVRNGGAKWIP